MPTDDVVSCTYRLSQLDGRYYAESLDTDTEGEGATKEEAVESLREALARRFDSPDAVAPPSVAPVRRVVLVEAP
jgi:hypothetical protein